MISGGIAESLRGMPSGTHAILIYDTPENKHEILFNHLRFGVDQEELVYACAEETPERVQAAMTRFGLDVLGLKKRGMLEVRNYDEVYMVNGRVDIDAIVMRFSDMAWASARKGLNRIRASGEMFCFFRHGMVKELARYEYALHRKLAFPRQGDLCLQPGQDAQLGRPRRAHADDQGTRSGDSDGAKWLRGPGAREGQREGTSRE